MLRYLYNLIKYMLLVVVITVITIVAMSEIVIRDFKPTYESTTSLLVSRHPDDSSQYEAYVMLQEVQIAEKLANDIPEMVFSTQVRQAVNQALPLELSATMVYDEENFRKSVKTETVRDSRVVNVVVRHSNPEGARLVAETIALTIDQLIVEITGQKFIYIIRTAEKPVHIAGLEVKHLWALSVLGGILLGMGLVLLITLSEEYLVSYIAFKVPWIRDSQPDLTPLNQQDKWKGIA